MDNLKKIKCSCKKHSEIDAINYCQECKIYLCNKCINCHSELFETHHLNNINKNIDEIFTGYCKKKDHTIIKFFCENHNQLCDNEDGQHKDCNVYFINEIKENKRNKLKESIKYLENLSIKLEQSIEIEFKKIKEKETLKLKISQIFEKIGNELEILLEKVNQFNNLYYNEDLIEKKKELQKQIQLLLVKGKTLEKDWDKNELSISINDCIEIENIITEINMTNKNIQRDNSNKNNEIKFNLNENKINDILERIKKFGNLYYNKLKFRICPLDINENLKYKISGKNMNIATKTGEFDWGCILCENELVELKEFRWKIKILNSKENFILVGVTPSDFDYKENSFENCGWYFHCNDSTLYSGPPHNYYNRKTNLSKVKDEIIIVMNMNKRTLKYIINDEDKGESYINIPIDKPLFPSVFLNEPGDSIELIEC